VGKSVAASAAASNLKKVALELGGKNPQVIFPDADIEAALDAVLFGVYFNMGECCNSGSRILVHETIAEDFVKQLVARAKKIKVGDPLNPDVKLGAIIEPKHKLKILSHIETAQKEGAKLETGGQLMKSPCGCYIEPTIFSGVKPQMTIAREEVFGPVLSVLTFKDADEAARIVNDVAYGLSASVWSKDVDTAFKAARSFRAGTVWINTFMDGANELPFGGYRQSGLGRELGKDAALEYTEAKTIVLHLGGRSPWLN